LLRKESHVHIIELFLKLTDNLEIFHNSFLTINDMEDKNVGAVIEDDQFIKLMFMDYGAATEVGTVLDQVFAGSIFSSPIDVQVGYRFG